MNRRTFLKKAMGFSLAFLSMAGGGFYYSREVETAKLHIQKEIIRSEKLPKAFDNKKIVHFSDTHLGFHYSLKDLSHLVDEMNRLNPDIIVFTGDLIDDPKQLNEDKGIGQVLKQLKAKDGKYWVYGNHDHGGYGTEKVLHIMNQAEFTLLQNSNVMLTIDNEQICLAGIDDLMLGKPDLNRTLQNTDKSTFTILLAHEPDFADEAAKYPVDIQLSGHSHGGQIRLPIIGHLYTPHLAEKYVLGKYQLKNGLKLFVNGGIGTTRIPYRLFCEPEIHEYTLKTMKL